jgi:hypothetical protein
MVTGVEQMQIERWIAAERLLADIGCIAPRESQMWKPPAQLAKRGASRVRRGQDPLDLV